MIVNFEFSAEQIVSLGMSALVAGVTVCGKAIGKGFAISSSTEIVHMVGKVIWSFTHIFKKKDR